MHKESYLERESIIIKNERVQFDLRTSFVALEMLSNEKWIKYKNHYDICPRYKAVKRRMMNYFS